MPGAGQPTSHQGSVWFWTPPVKGLPQWSFLLLQLVMRLQLFIDSANVTVARDLDLPTSVFINGPLLEYKPEGK